MLNKAFDRGIHYAHSDKPAYRVFNKQPYLQGHKFAYRLAAMTFAERIKAARKHAGLTQRQLADRAKVEQPLISQLENGKTMKTAHLTEIAQACGVSALWLSSGAGSMTGKSPAQPEANAELMGAMSAWDSSTPLGDDEVAIPLYKEVEMAAGSGSTHAVEESGRLIRFAKSTLREAGVQEENAACATVTGRSMERLIMAGATIGIDRGTTAIEDGEIYAIDHDGMLRVKYLYRLPGGGLRIRSENDDEYPDEILSAYEASRVRILGWVFWWSTVRKRRGLSIAR